MRVCSAIQPSGSVHLGNYFGALRNWVQLQNKGHECFYFIADLHSLTSAKDPVQLRAWILEMAATLLAIGIDPERSTLFLQSAVPAHTQLGWALQCLAPFGELERMVQFKEKSEQDPSRITVGLFAYPILQAADILLYQPDMVPVGIDQAQHLELTRTLARKFNHHFCSSETPLFKEPQTLHTKTLKILGLDGKRKMSKSYNNYISLIDDEKTIYEKLRHAATDPARVKRTDPGTPEICNIFAMHGLFSSPEEQEWSAQGCRTAGIGCVSCKQVVAKNITAFLEPIRDAYYQYRADTALLEDILQAGAQKAQKQAHAVLKEVYALLGLKGHE